MLVGSVQDNIVKITFDPKKEALLPGDFLSVTDEKGYGNIIQVIKLKNSEKTASQAAIGKIIFTLKQNNPIKWIGNIPSSKDIVKKISPLKALKNIISTETQDTIALGEFSSYADNVFNADIDKFDGLNLIFTEKQKSRTETSLFLANAFVQYGLKTVIIDFKGEYKDIPSSTVLKAGKNFKLPLDFNGIGRLYENCLSGASIETRAVIEDVFSQVQEYAESSEIGFIPFKDFKNVVEEEFNENKVSELVLLKNKLVNLSKEGIFSDRRNEIDSFQAALTSKDFIIIDLSDISTLWHKDFLELILNKSSQFILFMESIDSVLNTEIINQLCIKGIEKGIIPFISIESNSKYASSFLSYAKNFFITSQLKNSETIFEAKESLFGLNFADMVVYGEVSGFIPLLINNIKQEKITKTEEVYEEEIFEDIPEEAYEQSFEQPVEDFSELYEEEESEENTETFEDIDEEPNEEQEEVFYYDDSQEETDLFEEHDTQESVEFQVETYEEVENFEDIPEDVYDEVEKLYTYQGEDAISYDDLATETIEEQEEPEQISNNIPVYSTPKEEISDTEVELFEGDKVRHEKYGVGIVNRIISYGNKKLCSIQFDNVGRRLLDPSLASLEKV